MLKFETKGNKGEVILTLPTSLDELTNKYLIKVTEDIHPADNMVLIALAYREKLANVIVAVRQNKNTINSSIVPLFVKAGKMDDTFVSDIIPGRKLILASSDIAIGHHVTCPKNTLTISNIVKYTEGDGYAYKNALNDNRHVYFVEFKIVPACAIKGFYTDDNFNFDNPFVVVNKDNKEV